MNLELTKFVSCCIYYFNLDWFNEYSVHLRKEIYFLMKSLHSVFICFAFIVIFNIPIGIIILISILCSENIEEREKLGNKRKNI